MRIAAGRSRIESFVGESVDSTHALATRDLLSELLVHSEPLHAERWAQQQRVRWTEPERGWTLWLGYIG